MCLMVGKKKISTIIQNYKKIIQFVGYSNSENHRLALLNKHKFKFSKQ